MNRCSAGAAFGAFVGGAILGGAIALLLAPRSGAETRGMIRDFVDDEIDAIKDKALDAREYAADTLDKYKRRARRVVGELEGMVAEARENAAVGVSHAADLIAGHEMTGTGARVASSRMPKTTKR
ncbi:MAG: YtxH domain-containing protein [Alistipes sp.]|jgi:gas vesicle protein|nr:YtxH domain-containing protein [Alistipes sp.]